MLLQRVFSTFSGEISKASWSLAVFTLRLNQVQIQIHLPDSSVVAHFLLTYHIHWNFQGIIYSQCYFNFTNCMHTHCIFDDTLPHCMPAALLFWGWLATLFTPVTSFWDVEAFDVELGHTHQIYVPQGALAAEGGGGGFSTNDSDHTQS